MTPQNVPSGHPAECSRAPADSDNREQVVTSFEPLIPESTTHAQRDAQCLTDSDRRTGVLFAVADALLSPPLRCPVRAERRGRRHTSKVMGRVTLGLLCAQPQNREKGTCLTD